MKANYNRPESKFYETMIEFDVSGNLITNLAQVEVFKHSYSDWEYSARMLDVAGIGGDENREFSELIKRNSSKVIKWYQHALAGVAIGYGSTNKTSLYRAIERDIKNGFKEDLELLCSKEDVDIILIT